MNQADLPLADNERKAILNAFKSLLRAVKDRSKEDSKLIRKAFDLSLEAHKDERRKSGELYIWHPISVARICADEMNLDSTAIVCALLHDTVEDTYITLQDIEDSFGVKIRNIIDGLTKIPDVFDENASVQAENFRKMILTISNDFRVVLIKLADRLHNMRTLEAMSPDKQLKIASETRFLYAPLAHRFGFYTIKTELEDLSMKYCEPEVFRDIESRLKSTQDVRTRFIRRFIAPVKEELLAQGFQFDIKIRTKSVSSIWRKMKTKEVPFEEVYDVFAIRIIVNSTPEKEKSDCWKIYSVVTDFYQPSPERLRDWISTPRANGYESLQTTVMSPQGKWVEVQIRSKRMDEIAEKGIAAHYKYKEDKKDDSKFDRWISEIRDLLENTETNAIDFINEFKLNLFREEIYVFTPKGELRVLPVGATILDFAYDIHTAIGDRCIGAKVNNRLMPLSYELQNGDQLEIITSSKQKPNDEWLKFVVSARARQKIKASLNEERKSIAQDGKEIVERKFKQFNLKMNAENITFLEKFFGIGNATELYYRIAKGKIDVNKIREIEDKNGLLVPTGKETQSKKEWVQTSNKPVIDAKSDVIYIGDDFKGVEYQLSACCNPIPGDGVFGFITINQGIKIHRSDCPNAVHLQSKFAYRCIKAAWKSEILQERLAAIRIVGIDQIGLVNRLTEIISKENKVNMKSIHFETNDGVFEGHIRVMVFDTEHLERLMGKFQEIDGVQRVTRWDLEDDSLL
ncbi:MAG: bifunctional (p)ppGpp synthetase/guanosine-3',5'-bis(diphosphate) 3'-pyrophosphohydrolase [Flavobacteriia bacterium]|nr:bifunctional (p)ppGpp synthetase/guanosine-3',5'-bis(diphosphate) 3'-pyrophosphohydrolase [Flavobacteriia bacterium]